MAFLGFAETLGLSLASVPEIDRVLCRFCDECYAEGLGPGQGDALLAGWVGAFPEFGPGDFPYFLRALRGWGRLKLP
eukprot:15472321-Alexandrium_andersonii.AAC.1